MAKQKKAAVNDGFETVHSGGFAASWKPESAGEFIFITPTDTLRKIPKNKKMKKEGNIIECIYRGGTSDNFYNGKTQVELKDGDIIAIMLSHNLMDEKALAVEDGKNIRLSKMARLIMTDGAMMKIVFEGKLPIGGGRTVNQMIVQAPKGYKEKVQGVPVGKKVKK